MRRALAVFGSALFFVLAPGTVAGLAPWWISRWRFESSSIWRLPPRVVGGVLVATGSLVLLDSFARFAIKGWVRPRLFFRRVTRSSQDYIAMFEIRCTSLSWPLLLARV